MSYFDLSMTEIEFTNLVHINNLLSVPSNSINGVIIDISVNATADLDNDNVIDDDDNFYDISLKNIDISGSTPLYDEYQKTVIHNNIYPYDVISGDYYIKIYQRYFDVSDVYFINYQNVWTGANMQEIIEKFNKLTPNLQIVPGIIEKIPEYIPEPPPPTISCPPCEIPPQCIINYNDGTTGMTGTIGYVGMTESIGYVGMTGAIDYEIPTGPTGISEMTAPTGMTGPIDYEIPTGPTGLSEMTAPTGMTGMYGQWVYFEDVPGYVGATGSTGHV